MAVFEVEGAAAFELGGAGGPGGGGGAALDGLEAQRRAAGRVLHELLDVVGVEVAGELGHDDARMHREGVDAMAAHAPVQLTGEQDVRRLRLPVRHPLVVLVLFELDVVEEHRRESVAR